jgi:hypothetical protein
MVRQRARNVKEPDAEEAEMAGRQQQQQQRLKAVQRPDRRTRSKSDITVPRIYADSGECNGDVAEAELLLTELEVSDANGTDSCCTADAVRKEGKAIEAQQPWLEAATAEVTEVLPLPRIRKNNLNSTAGEYVYVSAVSRVANACPKPFVAAMASATLTATLSSSTSNGHAAGDGYNRHHSTGSYSRQNSSESAATNNQADAGETDQPAPHHSNSSTAELMNACKSGLRRLANRKANSRSRSGTAEPGENGGPDNNNNDNSSSSKNYNNSSSLESESPQQLLTGSDITYTQHSSGSRLPNRPTTPGPYLGLEQSSMAGLYKRPTTPGPFSRQSWKRTNQKFNYSKFLNYSKHETYV